MLIYFASKLLSTMSDNEKEQLDKAQDDQDEVGEAGSDPETSGRAEKLERTSLTRLLIPFFSQTLGF